MRTLRRTGLAVLSATVVALAIATLIEAHRRADQTLGGDGSASLVVQLGAGLALWAAGIHIATGHGHALAGGLLAAAGLAVFLGELPLPETGGAVLFTAALVGGGTMTVLTGAAALLYTRRSRLEVVGAGCALVLTVFLLGLVPAATFDPDGSGCYACPDNLALIHGDARVHDKVTRVGLYCAVLCSAVLVALTLHAWAGRPGPIQRRALPITLAGAGVAALGAVGFAHDAPTGVRELDATVRALWLAQCTLATALGAGIAWQTLRDHRLSRRISGIVIDALPSAEHLRRTLATAVGDPTLAIVFPDGDGGWIDAEGRPAGPPSSGAGITNVMRGHDVVAQMRLGTASAPERTTAAARGAGLALEHASLRAKLRAELGELAASRARIVQTGDRERQRLERNLHDGAQQRLIALTFALQQLHDPDLDRASAELQAALDDLRTLAHGIHPVALTEAGLEAAVRELADHSPVALRVTELPTGRFADAVEGAAYRLLLDTMACAKPGRAEITIALQRRDNDLHTVLTLPGVERDAVCSQLQPAADRIAASAGQLAIRTTDDSVVVEASLPCGS